MTSLAVGYRKISSSFKRLRPAAVAFTGLMLSALALVFATMIMRADHNSGAGPAIKRTLPPSALIAATNAGARAFTAVGQQAKLINASLPFDSAPVEAARPFVIGVDEANYPRALLCLRAAVYHEAGFEPRGGRQAVAQVILNRVRHSAFPKSVCDVVYQGAGTPVCQFSFACDQARHRPVAATAWREAEQIAAEALAGYVDPSVGTSTHYHADYVAPRWAPLLTKVSQTGTHIFYRWPGTWGQRPAFFRRYLGEQASVVGQAMELDAATKAAVGSPGVRGVAVVEVWDGKISEEAVRGVYNRGATVRAGDLWNLGPNEKLVTATLIARLVEQKILSWDAPLSELFPDLAPYMRPELQSVTLVQLLSGRSILAAKNEPAFAAALAEGAHPLIVQRASYIEKALNSAKATGKSNSIRDPGLVIAVAAVEGATERSYEDLVREEIFEPLGMRSAGFTVAPRRSAKPAEERVAGHPTLLSPAGRMHMSLRDFATFLIDQTQGRMGKGKLLNAPTYRRLHKPINNAQKKRGQGAFWHVEPSRGAILRMSLGHHWIAGMTMRAHNSEVLIVVDIPEQQNGFEAFDRALSMARLTPSQSPSDR